MTTVYVAGASAEIERAEYVRDRLTALGFTVVHDWMAQIRAAGASNPVTATDYQRIGWARECLQRLTETEFFIFLYPNKPTTGAWVELGVMRGYRRPFVVISLGGQILETRCIFTYGYPTEKNDELAIQKLCAMAKHGPW